MTLAVLAPVAGVGLPLERVPDPVFAQAMVGPGAAVDPAPGVAGGPVDTPVDAVAPVSGTLVKLHPHAFVVRAPDGVAVLVHLGIDTVRLGGAPFSVRAREGDEVRAGDVVVSWDVAAVRAAGLSPVVPVVVLEADADLVRPAPAVADGGPVTAGDVLITVLDAPGSARTELTDPV